MLVIGLWIMRFSSSPFGCWVWKGAVPSQFEGLSLPVAQDCKCWELRIVSRLCLLKFDDEPAKRAKSVHAKTPTKCSSAMNSQKNRSRAWLHSLRTGSLNPENNYLVPIVPSTACSGCSNVNAIKPWSGFGGFQVILAMQMARAAPKGYHHNDPTCHHSSRALCPLCLLGKYFSSVRENTGFIMDSNQTHLLTRYTSVSTESIEYYLFFYQTCASIEECHT